MKLKQAEAEERAAADIHAVAVEKYLEEEPMTRIQGECRLDQIHAARIEFETLWEENLKHRVKSLEPSGRCCFVAEHIAWHAFVAGKLAQDLRKAAQ